MSVSKSPVKKRPATASQMGSNARRHSRQVLSLSPAAEDGTTLRRILGRMQWRVETLSTCQAAIRYLKRKRVAAVVCEQTLPDGGWKNILQLLAVIPTHPVLIVTSRLADDYLWSEVLNLGGYNVLAKPFDTKEVRHVFACVWHEAARSHPRSHVAGVA